MIKVKPSQNTKNCYCSFYTRHDSAARIRHSWSIFGKPASYYEHSVLCKACQQIAQLLLRRGTSLHDQLLVNQRLQPTAKGRTIRIF